MELNLILMTLILAIAFQPQNGTDSFTYTVNDNNGATSNTATVNLTINSVNDAPVANNDNITTNEDTPVTIPVLDNDTDVDGTLDKTSIAIATNPSKVQTALSTPFKITKN
jgi:hypothetical protein